MATWFTADTHFGHSAIIGHCARPFGGVDEMDEAMIAGWNAVVRPPDYIWHLGDFAFGPQERAARILKRLHGHKQLIWGNHDRTEVRELPGWETSQPFREIQIGGHRIALMHYAMRVWPGSHHGALHLYGHSHGRLPGDRQSCDVGVDAWGYRPILLPEIMERMATQPERGSSSSPPE